ncbi:hypothetical protein FC26_GL000714 [Paucilactobacillus vaccinostercus DSM 20634]|jgi:uncharacterized protein YrzB (UPF0473 family)|uniref:UPF0473 protein FC26_GL000714 n=1 Tax=Paucilactobacillus vaccinostercus DSM 20634 TaxID=1423813 RepID=A0A0R2A1W2_9LACO|nr:DUF1292 domain-containing protein [Paucilactobacillus vaccinostercus]KRM60623.1 hypothetical protein FC26_GL000714 [Paucilactobacillus vaccinostercus DSM 20634]RRG09016.1 MAG: DUF1292 domain-containing protein [Lactobacillus sp.]
MSEQAQNDDFITLVDDQGNEELYKVLFTFDSDDYGKSYILLYPASAENDEQVDIQAYAYQNQDDGSEGELEPIEDDAEWDMVEEVLNTFLDDDGNFNA